MSSSRRSKNTSSRRNKNKGNLKRELVTKYNKLDNDKCNNELFEHWNNLPETVRESSKIIRKPVVLEPRTKNQEKYINHLENVESFITVGIGPAGSGKTLLATLVAIKMLQKGDINKIVITRPAVSVDEQHGFLPGDMHKKMEPWIMPIIDVFAEYYSQREIQKMVNDKIIAIEPLAYMRGRTFKNSFIIADETQNCTPDQMKMLLTRIGENSKMVITGDVKQHDRGFEKNGLIDFVNRIESSKNTMINIVKFDKLDIQRHRVIEHVLKLYGE